ncbi:hypothetical protein GGX14DRAFT_391333 [Mycena pura]|uniref:CRIB domain-containing protein n=1 Tax=Mycena pura TaxID=153505 RepID=A0AAD6VQ65_9AGAR|nr:hypothetical protein GGX14DRAFT_391333 [Mycena pura]
MISQLLSPTTKINEKSLVVPGLDPTLYTGYAVILARVYHAAFGSKQSEWVYSGLKGSLVFGKERAALDGQGYWFRLLDDAGKTIWIFKIPEKHFEYRIDKPFFHVFGGCSRQFGFLFTGGDDDAAALFAKRLLGRTTTPTRSASIAAELPRSIRSRLASGLTMGRLSPAPVISAPTANSFVHVAHVGAKKNSAPAALVVEANEGESWTMVLAEEGVRPPTIFIEQHNIADDLTKGPGPSTVEIKDEKQNQSRDIPTKNPCKRRDSSQKYEFGLRFRWRTVKEPFKIQNERYS